MSFTRGAVGGFMVGVLLTGGLLATPAVLGSSVSLRSEPDMSGVDRPADCPPVGNNAPPSEDESIAASPPAIQTDPRHGSFQICGPGNAQLEREIEQLIAGRSFSVSLRSHGNGCSDLEVDVTSATPNSGRQSSTLTVGIGANQTVTLRIVSEGGRTSVSITGSA